MILLPYSKEDYNKFNLKLANEKVHQFAFSFLGSLKRKLIKSFALFCHANESAVLLYLVMCAWAGGGGGAGIPTRDGWGTSASTFLKHTQA